MVVDTASVVGAAIPDSTSVVDAIVDHSSDPTIDPTSDGVEVSPAGVKR